MVAAFSVWALRLSASGESDHRLKMPVGFLLPRSPRDEQATWRARVRTSPLILQAAVPRQRPRIPGIHAAGRGMAEHQIQLPGLSEEGRR